MDGDSGRPSGYAGAAEQLEARLAKHGVSPLDPRLLSLARASVRLQPGRQGGRDEVLARMRPFREAAPSPQPVEGIDTAVAIVSGGLHCLALLEDGRVLAWGANESGQLGDGTRTDRRAPVDVGLNDRAVGIAAGGSHSLALLSDGTVVAWGSNRDGCLGDGTSVRRRLTPVLVGPLREGVVAVAAGENHSVALTESGGVVTWRGPAQLVAGLPAGVRSIAAGRHETFAITHDGVVFRWSFGDSGPTAVVGLEDIVLVSAGDGNHLALRRDGSVWGWGWNSDGELADGTTARHEQPIRSSALPPGVEALALGSRRGLAIVEDGSLWEWGREGAAQVSGLERGVRAIAAGRTALALLDDGTVRWWWKAPLVLPEESRHPDDLPLGASKLGGRPDLPDSTTWPCTDGWPQAFVAQVNLSEVAAVDGGPRELPSDGLLSFFYDAEAFPDGYSPADRGGWCVVYSPSSAALTRRGFPEELYAGYRFEAVPLRPALELTLPSVTSLLPRGESLSEADSEVLWDLEREQPQHRLLGYQQAVQPGHIQARRCQLASSGIDYNADITEADLVAAEREAEGWLLLAQFDSDQAAGMTWGDVGRLYYWIRSQDLAERRFDKTWVIAQCH